MPGVPEQPKPREESKKQDKEVDSATQTDDKDDANSRKSKADDDHLSDERVEQLKKDPKVVVHCELQEELDKEFEQRGLHFDSPSKPGEEGNDNKEDDNKQKAGDDTATKPAA